MSRLTEKKDKNKKIREVGLLTSKFLYVNELGSREHRETREVSRDCFF